HSVTHAPQAIEMRGRHAYTVRRVSDIGHSGTGERPLYYTCASVANFNGVVPVPANERVVVRKAARFQRLGFLPQQRFLRPRQHPAPTSVLGSNEPFAVRTETDGVTPEFVRLGVLCGWRLKLAHMFTHM